MKSEKKGFTLRVYGLLVNAQQEVLIAEEMFKNRYMVKFPGGGLEWGESTIDGLKREFREELGIDVKVSAHFYTTDFFIVSAFNPSIQLISIYYLVSTDKNFRPQNKLLNRDIEEDEIFRFVSLKDLNSAAFFTFPIDQKVGQLLQQHILKAHS